jgi:hypothetical protein
MILEMETSIPFASFKVVQDTSFVGVATNVGVPRMPSQPIHAASAVFYGKVRM